MQKYEKKRIKIPRTEEFYLLKSLSCSSLGLSTFKL